MSLIKQIKSSKIKLFIFDFILLYLLLFLFYFLLEVQGENFMAWYYDNPALKSESVFPLLQKELLHSLWFAAVYAGIVHFYYKTSVISKII